MSSIGFEIEGIGLTTTESDGTIWYRGDVSPSSATTGDYGEKEVLVDLPGKSTDEVDPQTGEISFSSFSPVLEMTPTVSETFNARQTNKVADITEDLGESETDVKVDGTSNLSSGDIIYIGSETMKIDSISGSTLTVTRGFHSSTAVTHGSQEAVYQRPPFYQNRLIKMHTFHAATSSKKQRWLGYIEKVVTQSIGTKIKLECEAAGRKLREAESFRFQTRYLGKYHKQFNVPYIGFGDENISSQIYYFGDEGQIKEFSTDTKDNDADIHTDKKWVEQESEVAKKKDFSGNQSTGEDGWYGWPIYVDAGTGEKIELQKTETGTGGQRDSADGAHMLEYADVLDLFGGNKNSEDDPYEMSGIHGNSIPGSANAPEKFNMNVYEIAAWDHPAVLPYPIEDARRVVDHPWDPVFIAATLLFSTDQDQIEPQELDFLDGEIGLDAGFLFGDQGKQSFIDKINESGNNRRLDTYILGHDGEPISVIEEVLKLLVGHNLFLAPRTDGQLSLKEFKPVQAEDLPGIKDNDVTPIFDMGGEAIWEWGVDTSFGQQIVQAKYGGNPVHDSYRASGLALEAQSRMTRLQDPESTEIDLNHIDPDRFPAVESILQRQAQLIQARMPTVKFLADDWVRPEGSDRDYDVGSYVWLKLPSEVDPPLTYDTDGTFLNPSNAEDQRFAGQIVHRQWNPKNNRYILKCVLTSYETPLKRLRAPAAACDGTTSDGSGSGTEDEIGTQAGVFGFGNGAKNFKHGDSSYWKGQEVILVDDTMAIRDDSTLPTITGVSGSTLELDDSFSVSPNEDDLILLADYNDYTQSNSAGLVNYNFMADSNDNLGSSDDPAHKYA